ncbi:exo-beta-N-acetylmuramidase NamZ family protein [Chryseolinea lacunae]|uniref:DUF1343 domain-containing protein n=1 Tax=Chryseolinea lacunae TaxID=2801331 RepID=A0ABS1KT75_9BACT|nr:DUF1343 domain-containing protein [Chryseolinea lacunae]MBL0742650.1 DUF1343 domain-containing protein [Chryseolinea lacunae]
MKKVIALLLIVAHSTYCSSHKQTPAQAASLATPVATQTTVVTGAQQLDVLVPKLAGKRVALVVNYTAMVGKTHLADTLKTLGVNIKKIMSPEHGFRGNAAAGEHVKDGVDPKTGLAVVSLYGNNRKPTPEQLADVDVVVFDIQDVGIRFFTYVGTLHYLMEACAENNKKVIVLDRPNPNASYIDGPVLLMEYKSFIGMHPVPIVHGLTTGEYARVINGEGWLEGGKKCELEVVPLKHWTHADAYSLPVKPSPNLPNDQAVRLYPSICFFEGTPISLGRGTQTPFQVIGHPDLKTLPYQFTPVDIAGMATDPPQENKLCYGLDLRNVPVPKRVDLHYLIDMYKLYPDKANFFVKHFERWSGTPALRQQIIDGLSEDQIRATWQSDLDKYKLMRQKYVLYP